MLTHYRRLRPLSLAPGGDGEAPVAEVLIDLVLAALAVLRLLARRAILVAKLALAPVENDPHPRVAGELLGEELVQLGVRGRHDEEVPELRQLGRGAVLPDADPELVEECLPGGSVGFRLRPAARPGVRGTEAEVGPADEGAHAQLLGEPERRLVALQRLVERRRIAADADLAQQVMRVRLVAT